MRFPPRSPAWASAASASLHRTPWLPFSTWLSSVCGASCPPPAQACNCSCFRWRFNLVFDRVDGICVQWATASSSETTFFILGLRANIGVAFGSAFSFPVSLTTTHAPTRPCTVLHSKIHLFRTGCPPQFVRILKAIKSSVTSTTKLNVCIHSKRGVQVSIWDLTLLCRGVLCFGVARMLSGVDRGGHMGCWHVSWPYTPNGGAFRFLTDGHPQLKANTKPQL